MRTLTIALMLAAAVQAQSLEDRYAKKMASPFVKNVAWVQDFDAAKKLAKKEKKVIFAYFSRSFRP